MSTMKGKDRARAFGGEDGSLRKTMARRAKRAGLAVVAIISAASLLDLAFQLARPGPLQEAAVEALRGAGIIGEPFDSAARSTESFGLQRLPEGFEDEVGLPDSADDVRVDARAGGGVVGFVVSEESERAFDSSRDLLLQRGWTAMEGGRIDCGSFVKGSGAYRWLFVVCTRVGDATSVTVHYTMEGGAS